MKEWAVATGGGCKPHWDVSWLPVPLQLLQRCLETCKKTSKACRGTAGVGLFNQSGDKQEGRWLRHVTDQTDEFGKREQPICLCSELGSRRIEVPGAGCLPSPARGCGSTTLPSLTSGGDAAADGAVLPFVQSWSSMETSPAMLSCFLGSLPQKGNSPQWPWLLALLRPRRCCPCCCW